MHSRAAGVAACSSASRPSENYGWTLGQSSGCRRCVVQYDSAGCSDTKQYSPQMQAGMCPCMLHNDNELCLTTRASSKNLSAPAQQNLYLLQVFDHVGRPTIEPVTQGISGTLFAYGVTSSGKTHTMMGTAADPGLVPRAIQELFSYISQATDRCVSVNSGAMGSSSQHIISSSRHGLCDLQKTCESMYGLE